MAVLKGTGAEERNSGGGVGWVPGPGVRSWDLSHRSLQPQHPLRTVNKTRDPCAWLGSLRCFLFSCLDRKSGHWQALKLPLHSGSPCGSLVKNPPANAGDRRCRFDPWVRKILWRRKWQPTPISVPGESHGQRSLVGYCLWGRRELDTTEHTHTYWAFFCAARTENHGVKGASGFPGLSPFSHELAVVKWTQAGLPLPWALLPGLQCSGTESRDTPSLAFAWPPQEASVLSLPGVVRTLLGSLRPAP